jgi:acid phosphatase type 7
MRSMRWLAKTVLLTALGTAILVPGSAWADPVVTTAGDIACDPTYAYYNGGLGDATHCHQKYTSDVVLGTLPVTVLPLGDNQYNSGTLSAYRKVYDPTWGRFKSITRPVLGNHEGSGTGYFDYFNGVGVSSGPAGQRGKGYYSFDVGTWHLIALNSNCSRVSCSKGSAQEQWLRSDLALNRSVCTLAYWHHPRFSSGFDGDNTFMNELFKDLYNAGADVLLSGHSHDYERFAPQNPGGKLDRTSGIRQFVVGTGGAFFTGFSTVRPNSEVRNNKSYGVLRLTLHGTSYDWKLLPDKSGGFTDSGSTSCHL